MIPRRLQPLLEVRLDQVPVVVLTGPRQAGKTALALEVARRSGVLYRNEGAWGSCNAFRDP